MPLTVFDCPDGGQIQVEKCLERCRMAKRCLALPLLWAVAYQRPKQPERSVTELLNPYRITYLRETKAFSVAPRKELFKVRGSGVHFFLERPVDQCLQEYRAIIPGLMCGTVDYYDGTTGILTDWKIFGKYKVKMLLQDWQNEGTEVRWQLNGYRLLLEHEGFHVKEMECFVIVRDWRSYEYKRELASKKGEPAIPETVTFPVEIFPLDEVSAHFHNRRTLLDDYFRRNVVPPFCSPEETWGGIRCREYCSVVEPCGIKLQQKGELPF